MTNDHVNACLESLYEVRARMHNNLDARTSKDLDSVIQQLEAELRVEGCEGSDVTAAQAADDALAVLARIIDLHTNVAELIEQWWS